MNTLTAPIEIKRGSVCVRIRCIYPSKDYPNYRRFVLDYHEDGHRQRPTFATLKEARKEAAAIAARLSRGDSKALTLTGSDRADYVQAMEALHPHQAMLSTVANDYAQGLGLLNGKGSIIEACRFYAAAHGDDIRPMRVQTLVDDLIETRKQNHASERHRDDLRSRLDRFAKAFQCDVHTIRAAQVQDFLSGLKLSARSINNYRTSISNLFTHARLRGHAAKAFDPLAGMPWAKETEREVGIYSPDDLKLIIQAAQPGMLPYVCIAAFAGLRQAELARLDWIMVKSDHIVVGGDISKKGVKRMVPILPNLAAWLEDLRRDSGPVVPYKNISNEVCELVRKAEVSRQTNGLRHSYGTHRLAVLKNPDAVAFDMGNSRRMVLKSYWKVIQEPEGRVRRRLNQSNTTWNKL